MLLSTIAFKNRHEAAKQLGEKLTHYQNQNPLVLGIPRGSVPIAKVIAEMLNGDLDVVLVHKIGFPNNPEFAIGSVSEFGDVFYSSAVEEYRIPQNYMEKAAKYELDCLKKRRQKYSPVQKSISPKNRIVLVVDDGIATGSTIVAAVRSIRSQSPKKIVVAAPVASPRAIDLIRPYVDEIVVLAVPDDFFSISQFYGDFPQVSDQEVLEILSQFAKEPFKCAHQNVA